MTSIYSNLHVFRKVLALTTLGFCLSTATSTPSRAIVAIAQPLNMPVFITGMAIAGVGATGAWFSLLGIKYAQAGLIIGITSGVLFGVGLIIVDEGQISEIHFQALSTEQGQHLGISERQRVIFNSQLRRANNFAKHIGEIYSQDLARRDRSLSSISPQELDLELEKLWLEACNQGLLSSETIEVIQKIRTQARAPLS